jgi:hypothetical protein
MTDAERELFNQVVDDLWALSDSGRAQAASLMSALSLQELQQRGETRTARNRAPQEQMRRPKTLNVEEQIASVREAVSAATENRLHQRYEESAAERERLTLHDSAKSTEYNPRKSK